MNDNIKPTLDQHRDEIRREIQHLKEDLRNKVSDVIREEVRRGIDQMKRDVVQAVKDTVRQK